MPAESLSVESKPESRVNQEHAKGSRMSSKFSNARECSPDYVNHQEVTLTVERHDDLTTAVMVGGEKIYIDTMPETLMVLSLQWIPCSWRQWRSIPRVIARRQGPGRPFRGKS